MRLPTSATIHVMRYAPSAGVMAAVAAWVAWSQPPARPEFDVASLKPVALDGADTYTANLGSYRNGVLTQTNTTLAECIRFAYEITSDDLLSGPDWIKNKNLRFDILAKTAPATPRSQALLMLRTLQSGERGHENGAQPDLACPDQGLLEREVLLAQLARKLDDQDAVGNDDSSHHNHAHERHDVEGAVREPKNQHYSRQAWRDRHQDDQRVDEGSELRHQNQIDEHDGQHKTDGKAFERFLHADHGPEHIDPYIFRQRQVSDDLVDLAIDYT